MLSHYFRAILRNIWRYRKLNAINITGFSLGIASCFIIGNFVAQEFRYDRHHENFDRIYRVALDRVYPDKSVLWAPIAPGVRDGLLESPRIIDVARVQAGNVNLVLPNEQSAPQKAFFTDSSFFNIFSIKALAGNVRKSITDRSSIIISEKIAQLYFPKQNALGQIIRIENFGEFKVGAIVESCRKLSHFQYDVILPIHTTTSRPEDLNVWGSSFGYHTYILLDNTASASYIENTYFPKMADKYLGTTETYKQWKAAGNQYRYFLQPLSDIHLHSDLKWEMEANGSYLYVNLFIWVGLMILVIACINFMNLSSARFSTRLKEVGIRKVMGSYRKQIVIQFLLESTTLSAVSMVIALVIVKLGLPWISLMTHSQIEIFALDLPLTLLGLVAFTMLIGITSGIYPAMTLSSFNPVAILNNNSSSTTLQSAFRDYLVVIQFVISFFLLVGTSIVYKQIDFVQSKDLGFTKEQVLVIDNASQVPNKETFKEQLLQIPLVANVSFSADIPGRMDGASTYQKKGENTTEVNMTMLHSDENIFDTWQLTMKEGRTFTFTDFTDTARNVILNETAVKDLGLTEPVVGAELFNQRRQVLHVIGVVRNFHTESLHKEIRPMILFPGKQWIHTISVKVKEAENTQQVIADIEKLWHQHVPQKPLEAFFLADFYNDLYGKEEVIGKLSVLFTLLAILLATLGLYGLSSFAAEQRTREIGIRRVLGATTWSIVRLFLQKTNKLVVIAILFSFPFTHLLVSEWLKGFAYRTVVTSGVYITCGIGLMMMAVVTVFLHSYKAARLNPADTLRSQ